MGHVGMGGSCRGGVCHVGGVGHVGVGWGGSCRGGVGWGGSCGGGVGCEKFHIIIDLSQVRCSVFLLKNYCQLLSG